MVMKTDNKRKRKPFKWRGFSFESLEHLAAFRDGWLKGEQIAVERKGFVRDATGFLLECRFCKKTYKPNQHVRMSRHAEQVHGITFEQIIEPREGGENGS